MSEQERQVPVWHSIVGADHEPVQVNDVTHLGEDVLVASGWIAASGGGFRQQPDSLPRRRRKPRMVTWLLCSPGAAWFPSGEIPDGWVAIEWQTQPLETIKQLPVGEEP